LGGFQKAIDRKRSTIGPYPCWLSQWPGTQRAGDRVSPEKTNLLFFEKKGKEVQRDKAKTAQVRKTCGKRVSGRLGKRGGPVVMTGSPETPVCLKEGGCQKARKEFPTQKKRNE